MKTKLKIIQGAEQIGGNIVLLEGEKSRIIFDFGIPLTDFEGNSTELDLNSEKVKNYLPDIPDLYTSAPKKETLILLSHAHPDHFGLLRFINKSIPVYATKITKQLIQKTSEVLYNNLFDDLNIREIQKETENSDFVVKMFPVNHSIAGSCGFSVTDKKSGKKIVYTGDLRLHGRDSKRTEELINENKNAEYLIIEGTTLNRNSEKTKSESDIENDMTEIFSEDKMSIVCCSPLNIDRLVSVYNACIRANKTLVIDPYTAFILETFKERFIPDYTSDNIKVYCVPNEQTTKIFQDENNKVFGNNKTEFKDIMSNPSQYVIKDNAKITKSILKRMNIASLNIIYSYWEGYLNKKDSRWNMYKKQIKKIHTSGHISQTDLINFIERLNPQNIIPVHSLSGEKLYEFFGKKLLLKRNGDIINI